MAWNVRYSFHVASGSLFTSFAVRVTALGCHTTSSAGLSSPALPSKAGQSMPGARFANSARGQWLFPLCTSSDSTCDTCASAIFRSRSRMRFALAPSSATPASLRTAATWAWYFSRMAAMRGDASR